MARPPFAPRAAVRTLSLALLVACSPAAAVSEARHHEGRVAVELSSSGEASSLRLQQPPQAPAPDAQAATSTEAPQPFGQGGSLLANLSMAAQNLTDLVHDQANVVAQKTDQLATSEEQLGDASAMTSQLRLRYAIAHTDAVNASETLKLYLGRLEAAKQKRDGLRNQTEALQSQLSLVQPAYIQAENDLQRVLQEQPWLQGVANTTNHTDAEVGQELEMVTSASKEIKSEVTNQSSELQQAISQLNALNEQLRQIHTQMMSRSAGCRMASSVGTLLAALAVAAVARS